MLIGSFGIILVSVSGIGLAAESDGHCGYTEVNPQSNYTPVTVLGNSSVNTTLHGTKQRYCTPFTAAELVGSLLALMGGSLVWSISSSKSCKGFGLVPQGGTQVYK